ncbi:VOC family protein [Klebsiella aerogenes]|nr:VOC family protein [Klebsiella aerogenes]MEB5740869.1 VOC family protein [Klebsiella aerogenes]
MRQQRCRARTAGALRSDYGFSARFGWLNDRFGLSWQLNVPAGDLGDAGGTWGFQGIPP